MGRRALIGIIIAVIVVAVVLIIATNVTGNALDRSDRTIARVDRILDKYGK